MRYDKYRVLLLMSKTCMILKRMRRLKAPSMYDKYHMYISYVYGFTSCFSTSQQNYSVSSQDAPPSAQPLLDSRTPESPYRTQTEALWRGGGVAPP